MALRGVKVLDLSRILAGPWCTMLLGDAGAHVIKVERPKTGDDTRSWGPPFFADNNTSCYFLSVNRNKQSLALDLKTGRDIVHQLATEWADVLVENYKVGTMEKLGLDYDTLRQQNEGLVYCSITGFGPTGPYATLPGYDVIVSGMYGLMSITGSQDGDPAKVGVAMTDVLTGTLANSGILAALYERTQTGQGQRIDTSLMETQLASLVNIASNTLNNSNSTDDNVPKRWGTAHESIVPYQAFPCKPATGVRDKQYIVVGAGNDVQFEQLCQALDMPELLSESKFGTNAQRVTHRRELVALLEQRFLQETRDEWMHRLQHKGFPVGLVRTVPEAFECPQAIHRGMTVKVRHPETGGFVYLPRNPISFSNTTAQSPLQPPPMLGQHSEEILSSILHMNKEKIKSLEELGIVECWRPQ